MPCIATSPWSVVANEIDSIFVLLIVFLISDIDVLTHVSSTSNGISLCIDQLQMSICSHECMDEYKATPNLIDIKSASVCYCHLRCLVA